MAARDSRSVHPAVRSADGRCRETIRQSVGRQGRLHLRPARRVLYVARALGCGKTTLLRMLAGFVVPDEGRIFVDDELIDPVPPWKRNVGMVFQQYALWPHMSVLENVAFGLRVR